MKALWKHNLLFRSIAMVVVISSLLGLLTMSITAAITHERAYETATTRLHQLLDTVESTVQVACFVGDQTLADEVAQGLLSNSEVMEVTIIAGKQRLAHRQRAGTLEAINKPASTLRRDIYSPFNTKQIIGSIQLAPHLELIERGIQDEIRFVALQLGWQFIVLVLVITGTLLLILRPIKAMSDRLHHMDAKAGERLSTPKGQAHTEIGRLVDDVNALAGRLMESLEEERELSLQREMDEKKYHAIFENAESGIFIIDSEGRLSSWNPAFERLLEVPSTKAIEGALHLGALPWNNALRLTELIQEVLRDNIPKTKDLSLHLQDGTRRWLNLVLSPIGDNLLQGVVHDVTELKEAEATAKLLAVTDPLTGLANRHGLEAKLHSLVKEYTLIQSGGYTLMLVDLDEFKRINEGLGRPAGDEVLKVTTTRLSNCVKDNDTVARLSADTFGIILHNVTLGEDADKVASRILQALRQSHFIDGSPIRLHASIGIAIFPHDGVDVPTLLRHAELALDNAKASGGDTAVFFDPDLAEVAEQRRHLENDLRLALRNGDFRLYLQPIVDLSYNRLAGAEALIRWQHPIRGLVPPDAFIPIAEQTGLINDIGLWVLDAACAQLAAWEQDNRDLHLSINVSVRQIPDGLPPSALSEALQRYGVSPVRLALEITEGVFLSDIEKALGWLKAVHEIGCRVYLDDFGTGYSSLSYLKRFPVDTLKVDKSFVQDMQIHSSERTLVEAVVAMGRSLGLDVVAEGVEAAHQAQLLREMNCRYAQGYHYSRPVPIENFDIAAERVAALLATPAQ
ncbi:MAG: bifunctional diguanylate cyclase/phosphodiesterase [Sulfurimicrobium sp.]|nr:bifunctional diguanylate cyclase/phosphodiesterase [Sulfurimicrobium sp.]